MIFLVVNEFISFRGGGVVGNGHSDDSLLWMVDFPNSGVGTKKHAKKACKQNRSIHCLSTWGSLYAGSFCYFTAKIKLCNKKRL